MTYYSIVILAFVLSIDACVVSFLYGLTFFTNKRRNSFLLATFTSFFQGLMPLIGYYLTNLVKTYIISYSKFIAFFIFIYLGIKFIKEAFEEKSSRNLCINLKCLFLIGIATSIDAFSAGITLSLFGNRILKPILLITFITFVNAFIGFYIGTKFKKLNTRFLEVTAGIILILLGIKYLI